MGFWSSLAVLLVAHGAFLWFLLPDVFRGEKVVALWLTYATAFVVSVFEALACSLISRRSLLVSRVALAALAVLGAIGAALVSDWYRPPPRQSPRHASAEPQQASAPVSTAEAAASLPADSPFAASVDWSRRPHSHFETLRPTRNGRFLAVGNWHPERGGDKPSLLLLDPDFTVVEEFRRNVEAISLQPYFARYGFELYHVTLTDVHQGPGGKIYLLGAFAVVHRQGQAVSKPTIPVIRLLANGALDPEFTPGVFFGFIDRMLPLEDGFLVLQEDNRILRVDLDMVPDDGFPQRAPPGSVDGNIDQIALQPDGKLLLAGAFDAFRGRKLGGLVRLEVDGTIDEAFQAHRETALFQNGCEEMVCEVTGLVVLDDGRIVLTTSEYFTDTRGIVGFKPDGSLDRDFMSRLRRLGHGGLHSYGLMRWGEQRLIVNNIALPIRILLDGSEDVSFNEAMVSAYGRLNLDLGQRVGITPIGDRWLLTTNRLLIREDGRVVKLTDTNR